MKTIYKYELNVNGVSSTDIPKGAELLDISIQNGKIQSWFLVDTDVDTEPRMFIMCGTGQEIISELVNNLKFVKTVHDSPFVWHVFEIVKNNNVDS